MKKQNVLLYTIVTVSVILSLSLFIKVNKDYKHNKEAIAQLSRENMLFAPVQSEQLELLDFNLFDATRLEVSDINGEKSALSDMLKAGKTIVIYISQYYCKDCVNFVLNYIKTMNEKASCDNVVILADKYVPRDIHVFANINGIKNNFYIPEDSMLKNKMEYVGMPVVFVVDKSSGKISHVFVPHKEVPEYFNKYIDIATKYVCE